MEAAEAPERMDRWMEAERYVRRFKQRQSRKDLDAALELTRDALLRRVRRHWHPPIRENAEDITQIALIELWRRIHRFDPARGRSWKKWCCTQAEWVMKTLIKRFEREEQAVEEVVRQFRVECEAAARRDYLVSLLREALDRLPSPEREIVRAKKLEGLTWAETTWRFGLSVSTAQRLYDQGLAWLRKQMDELRRADDV